MAQRDVAAQGDVVFQGDVVAQEDVVAQGDVVHGSKRCGGSTLKTHQPLVNSYGWLTVRITQAPVNGLGLLKASANS